MNSNGEKIEIKNFDEKYIEQILYMVNQEFLIKKDSEYIIWQCIQNPNPLVIKVALFRNEVIGWFGIQKRILSTGLSCGQISYIFIRPDLRGRGLFKKIGSSAIHHFRELDVFCIFANASALIPFQKHFGLKLIKKIPYYHTYSLYQEYNPDGYTAKKITSSDDITQLPWNFTNQIYFLHDTPFNYWRFIQNVQYEYYLITISPAIYAVVKFFDDSTTKKVNGDIVQFYCDFEDENEISSLFTSISDFFSNHGIHKIITWIPDNATLINLLKKNGYTEGTVATNLLLKTSDHVDTRIHDYSRWVVMPSDATNY